MHRALLVALGVAFSLWIAPLGKAQNAATPHQHASASPMIDGAVHPELIPDSAAYRLYFLSISTSLNANDAERNRQRARIRMIGLSDSDAQALAVVMNDFKMKYVALVVEYNQAAAAHGAAPDISVLREQLGELVRTSRDTLKAHLSVQGLTQFDAFVQSEKQHMKVPAEGQ
ncbi:MAG TPA: hypothetical protein VMU53_18370 [Candidatus Sulfotelmatobacter sp.]|nr:hypothetical protein [Candidatus Sulfotelmatobacter sp.]